MLNLSLENRICRIKIFTFPIRLVILPIYILRQSFKKQLNALIGLKAEAMPNFSILFNLHFLNLKIWTNMKIISLYKCVSRLYTASVPQRWYLGYKTIYVC